MASSLFGKGYEPKEGTGSRKLPKGGYIVRIMSAKIENAKSSGLPMLVIQFDISDGEFSNYYHKKYESDKKFRDNAKYQGIARIPAIDQEGKARRGFNTFCGAVEKSNDIKLPQDDTEFLNMLKGKFVGIIFRNEEFRGSDGNVYMTAKPTWYRSVQTIESGEYDIPEDKLLKEDFGIGYDDADDFFGDAPASGSIADSFSAAEDDIPFN